MRFFNLILALVVLALVGSAARAQCCGGNCGVGANFGFRSGFRSGFAVQSSFFAPSVVVAQPAAVQFAAVQAVPFVAGGGAVANVNIVNQRGGLFGGRLFGGRSSQVINASAVGGGAAANVNIVNGRGRRFGR